MNSPTQALSEYIARARFENIPDNVLKDAKDYILDSIGCTVGGSTLRPGEIIIDFFTELGGRPEASILATGKKVPCIHAAYVNSYLANLLDFDDTSTVVVGHPGSIIIPTGLALAEKIGASGKDFITAVVIAYEVWARIAQAIAPSPERLVKVWGINTHQIFGAAIVSARLLKLNADQIANTLGLAGVSATVPNSRKVGVELEDRPITWIKSNFGWTSMGGMLAALLSEKGVRGNRSIFEGEKGFWIMAGSDRCDFEKMTHNLGVDYLITTTALKPYASCRYTHSTLDAIAEIMAKHRVDVNKIRSIKVKSFSEVVSSLGVSTPTSILDAQFSLPHLVALELVGKSPSKGLSEENLTDPKVRSLAERVSIELSFEAEEKFRQDKLLQSSVVIEQTDGSMFSEKVDVAKGDPRRRLTKEEIRSKFTYLTAPVIGINASEVIMHSVEELENLKDISSLIPSLW